MVEIPKKSFTVYGERIGREGFTGPELRQILEGIIEGDQQFGKYNTFVMLDLLDEIDKQEEETQNCEKH